MNPGTERYVLRACDVFIQNATHVPRITRALECIALAVSAIATETAPCPRSRTAATIGDKIRHDISRKENTA